MQQIQNDADRNSLVPLSLTLTALIKKLMLRYRESFIYPSAWMRYRDSLAAQFAQDEEVQPVFQFINSRNERLVRASKASASASRQALVRMLDQALLFPSRVNLAAQVWESSRDKEAVVRALLEWSTSLYRPGATKIYVAARLLRHWAVSHGLDVTWALLRFVESETLDSLGRKQLFYHLASELTRSGHFSVAGYVQWLISRGGIVDDSETDVDGPCGTRLLVELPLHALDESLLALRRSMLRRTSFPVNAEREDVAMAIRHLKHRLGLPLDPGDPLPGRRPLSTSKLARLIESSGRTLKSEIGFWIRGLFVTPPGSSSSSSRSAEKASAAKDKGSIGQMDVSTTVFDAVRTWLIAAQDYSMLADVLKAVAAGSDPDVLASVADTVNLDVETYLAIGAAADLFTALEARRKALYERSQQDDSGSVAIRPLVASLVSLGARLPGQAAATARLRQELARIDRNAALNPCSPISDNMQQVSSAGGGAAADASDERLAEEIEKLLANGNVLDPRTMERLAAQLVGLIETNWLQMRNVERLRTHAALLTRVRIHDPPSFDRIVTDWMASLRDNSKRAPLTTLLPFLVVCGCLTLPIILSTVPQQASQPRRHTSMSPRATYLQEVLQLIVMPPTAAYPALSSEEVFRYSIMQRVVQAEHARAVASLLRGALHEHCAMSVAEFRPYSLVLASDDTRRRLLSLLRVLVLADGPGVCQALSAPPQWEPRAGKLINDLTSRLVREGDMALGGDDDDVLSFDQIFESTTDFSLPFCQLKLAVTLAVEEEPAPSADAMVVDGVGAPAELQPSNMELFARAMDRAIEKRKNTAWTAMLSALGPDVVQHINAGATSRFLSLVPSLKGHTEAVAAGSWDPEATLATAAALLSVVEASTRNANGGSGAPAPPPSPSRATSFATSPQYPPSSHTVQMTAALGDKLQDIWEIVASADADADLKSAVLDRWLPLLLSFIIVHCPPAPLPSVASSGSSAANGSGGASSTTAANNMTTPGGPSSATTPAASHQASTPTAAGLAPPSSSSAERAAGESRGRLLVSLAGLLLDLDNQPAARIRSRPQSMLLQSPTAVPPPARQANAQPINDDVAMTPSQTALPPPPASSAADLMPPPPPPSLLLASAASCRLSSLVYDVALVLVDSLDDSLRAQCVRALGGAQGSAASDARIRYIFSIPVPPTSSGGSGLLLATRDRSAVVNNTAAAAGAPMMAMTTAAAVGSPQGSSGGSGTASQHGQEQAQGQGQGQSQVQSQVQGQVQTQIQGQGQVQSQGQGGQQQQVQFTTVSPAAAASAATAWLSIMAAERRAMMGGGAGGNPTLSAASAFASINGAPAFPEKLVPFVPRRWEILSEPTPNIGENDTSLSLTLFDAIKNRTGTSAM